MLLKNLRKQQEEEEKEEEERNRKKNEQKANQEEARERSVTITTMDSVTEATEDMQADGRFQGGEKTKRNEENEDEEILEISETIYHPGTGVVNNPLYTSQLNLSASDEVDRAGKDSSTPTHSTTSGASSDSLTNEAGANQNAEGKVNPVPKPPRLTERSLSTDSQQSSQDESNKAISSSESGGSQLQRSAFSSVQREGRGSGGVSGSAGEHSPRVDAFGEELNSEDELAEARNPAFSDGSDSETGYGYYQVNSDPENEDSENNSKFRKVNGIQDEDEDESGDGAVVEGELENSLEESYPTLISKMRLERGFSIDNQASGQQPLSDGSPETFRKDTISPAVRESSTTPSPVPVHENISGRVSEIIHKYSAVNDHSVRENTDVSIDASLDENLSDSEEKFENLYKELSKNSYDESDHQIQIDYKDPDLSTGEEKEKSNEDIHDQTHSSGTTDTTVNENGYDSGEDTVDYPPGTPTGTASRPRVNSIIKKKGSPSSSTGSTKRVQFNPEVDMIEPDTPAESVQSPSAEKKMIKDESVTSGNAKIKKDATGTSTGTSKTDKKTTESTPGSPAKKKQKPADSNTTSKKKTTEVANSSQSPAKKKGIFTSIFSSSSAKKTDSTTPAKDDNTSKKTTTPFVKRQPTVDLNAPLIISGEFTFHVTLKIMSPVILKYNDLSLK